MVSAAPSAIGGMSASGLRPAAEPPAQPSMFYKCSACGQAVDRRQLGEVLHHEVPNHRPIPSAIP